MSVSVAAELEEEDDVCAVLCGGACARRGREENAECKLPSIEEWRTLSVAVDGGCQTARIAVWLCAICPKDCAIRDIPVVANVKSDEVGGDSLVSNCAIRP